MKKLEKLNFWECVLLFSSGSFVVVSAIEKCKDEDLQLYNFMCCFVQVLDKVSDINPFGTDVKMQLGICWLRLRNISIVPSGAY